MEQNALNRIFAFVESLPIGDRFLLKGAVVVFTMSLMWFVVSINASTLIEIPDSGGVLSEGSVGTPRFINPILAVTTADQDLTALIYGGIMKLGPDGMIVPDIAESVTVSEDGRIYHVLLKKDVTFHDGAPLTVDDIIFTISRVQDPVVKSPLHVRWEKVSMKRLGEYEMDFILTESYAPFIENLTLGILPKHIWEHASNEELPFSQYNSEPVGAGPYKLSKIKRTGSGMPESYELLANKKYFQGAPKIEKLIVHFYPSEAGIVDAFKMGEISSAGGLSKVSIDALRAASVPFTLITTPLPRIFTLFFNQNENPLFRDIAVRKALEKVVDRDAIVQEVLGGYGETVASPIPPGFNMEIEHAQSSNTSTLSTLDEARELLHSGGWKINQQKNVWEKVNGKDTVPLTFSISTGNTPVFQNTAQLLKVRFAELGIPVTIKQFEQSDLVQTIIRPRKYEALLFGSVVGRELDLFSFWHSSQRNDPGLNVALYTNITTDALLSSAQASGTVEERVALYQKFSAEITKEVPAIFLYVPTYTYVTSPAVHNVSLRGLARGSERFSAIHDWYIEKDSVWPFFIHEK